MTPQSTFMIIAQVGNGQEAALRDLLASMNDAPGFANPKNPILPFYQFSQLHVARFVLLEANTNDDLRQFGVEPSYWPTHLAFVGDIDGRTDEFLAELVVRAGPGLRQIFSHCGGFDPHKSDLLQWLKTHSKSPTANYINWRGRTVQQVREEAQLASVLRAKLKDMSPATMSTDPVNNAETIRLELAQYVQGEVAKCRLRLSDPAPTPADWMLRNFAHLLAVPIALLILAPLMVLIAPLFFWQLRRLEKADPENVLRPSPQHVQSIAEQEDIDVTNHFNVFGQVKPGRFRRYTMRFLLLVLDYTTRHIYRKGYLTRIQTIHFARWVLLDNDRRIYFASNYDGSADSYMDDFINKVAWGLNLVFSNGVGYPRTSWLVKGGAEFEEKYKRTLRRNQLPSMTWYRAYPGLTAVDLARNARIRKGLEADQLSDSDAQTWLGLL